MISPSSGFSWPEMTFRSVDLPSPLRPVMQARSPASILTLTQSRISGPPKRIETSCRVTKDMGRECSIFLTKEKGFQFFAELISREAALLRKSLREGWRLSFLIRLYRMSFNSRYIRLFSCHYLINFIVLFLLNFTFWHGQCYISNRHRYRCQTSNKEHEQGK